MPPKKQPKPRKPPAKATPDEPPVPRRRVRKPDPAAASKQPPSAFSEWIWTERYAHL